MVSASTLRRQLDQVRKLLAVREDDFPHLPPLPPMTDEELAHARCQIWSYIAHRDESAVVAEGMAVVEEYERLTNPTPEQTQRFNRLIDECWDNFHADHNLTPYDLPEDAP